MSRTVLFFLFFLFSTGTAAATTVNISSQSRASAFGVPAQTDQLILDDVDTVGGPTSYAASTQATVGPAVGSSSGSVNIDSGLLRSSTQAVLPAAHETTGHEASGATEVSMETGFTASGSGNVTFRLAVDGFWDLAPRDGGALGWQTQGKLSLFDLGGTRLRVTDDFRLNATVSPMVGAFDDTLQFSFFVFDGVEYSIFTSLLTQISSGQGAIDFASTAALTIIPDPGVVLTYDDPRFLTVTNPQPAAVPLPASVFGLLAAMGALVVMRRRRAKRPGVAV